MKRLIVALLILSGLIAADIFTTIIGLSRGANDLNPLYYAQGFWLFLLFKLGFSVTGIVIYGVTYRYLKNKFPNYTKVIWTLLVFLIGFYSFIIANNITVLLRLSI